MSCIRCEEREGAASALLLSDFKPTIRVVQVERDLKRQCTFPSDQRTDSPPAAKKQCQDNQQTPWVPSEHFWDTLPKIHLTRRALIEHHRRTRQRNSPVSSESKKESPRRSASIGQITREKEFSILRSTHHVRSSPGLKRFAACGGPDLTAIRGFPDPTMGHRTSQPSRHTTTTGRTTSSKRTNPYDQNYELKLGQAGILTTIEVDEDGDLVLPANHDETISRLNLPRPSLSPSRFTEKDFRRFLVQTDHEILEAGTMSKSMAAIEGTGNHLSRMGGKFNNLKPFDPELAVAIPDSYDGAPPLKIRKRVLSDLSSYIVPSTDPSRPALPNFFVEGKSRQARIDVAKRQAAHYGAIGARGIMYTQSYPSPTLTYDKNAYSFTTTYHDGQLKIYTSHATAPEDPEKDKQPRYHMTQVGAFAMTQSSNAFREGATHYRNARDLAQEQRDAFIQQANQKADHLSTRKRRRHDRPTMTRMSTSPSFQDAEPDNSSDTDTSTDELAPDKVFKRSRHIVPEDGHDNDPIRSKNE